MHNPPSYHLLGLQPYPTHRVPHTGTTPHVTTTRILIPVVLFECLTWYIFKEAISVPMPHLHLNIRVTHPSSSHPQLLYLKILTSLQVSHHLPIQYHLL